jgi:hypothetical protein
MRYFFYLFSILFVMGMPTLSSAQETRFSGEDLLNKCGKSQKYLDNGNLTNLEEINQSTYCLGVLAGITGYNATMTELDRDHLYCPPSGITTSQQVRVLVKFLENNPKLLNDNGFVLAVLALSKAYCSGSMILDTNVGGNIAAQAEVALAWSNPTFHEIESQSRIGLTE